MPLAAISLISVVDESMLCVSYWPTADDQKTKICPLRVAAFIKQQRLGTNPTKQGLTGFCVLFFRVSITPL